MDESSPQPDDRIAEALEGIEAALRSLQQPRREASVQLEPVERDPFKEYDRLGRQQPQQFGWVTFFRNWPWLLDGFKPVPHQAVNYDGPEPVVNCPCDERRTVAVPYSNLVNCPGCHRSYFGLESKVLVSYRSEAAD